MNKLEDYSVFLARTIGKSHLQKTPPTPCEDYGLVESGEGYHIFIIADGHGSDNCFRSHIGSQKACEISLKNIKQFISTTYVVFNEENNNQVLSNEVEEPEIQDIEAPVLDDILSSDDEEVSLENIGENVDSNSEVEEELLAPSSDENEEKIALNIDDPKSYEPLVRQLIRSIVFEWNEDVSEHYRQNPPTPEELALAEPHYQEKFKKGERLPKAYGTTLIAAALTKDYLLIVQQGDSHPFVYDENFTPSWPVPWDKNCEGNVTTSLCDEDAVKAARYCLLDLRKHKIAAVLLGSDGVEDSFYVNLDRTSDYYLTVMMKMTKFADIPSFEKSLEEDIHELTMTGSGDDITIAGIVIKDLVEANYEKFSRKVKLDNLEFEKKNIEESIASKERKLNFLKSEVERINKKIIPEIDKLDDLENKVNENYLSVLENVVDILHDIPYSSPELIEIMKKFDEGKMDIEAGLLYYQYLFSLKVNKEQYADAIDKKYRFKPFKVSFLKKVETMFDELGRCYNDVISFRNMDNREKLKAQVDRAIKEYEDYKAEYEQLLSRLEEIKKELSSF